MSIRPNFEASDWKSTKLPKLSQLDSLQRCLICKDFLRAPVSTSCNHTFCSQCIREHLLKENLCPLCKSEQFESNLKRDILLEEIVQCFQSLRDELIELVSTNLLQPMESASNDKFASNHSSKSTVSSPDPEVIEVTDDSDLDRSAPSRSATSSGKSTPQPADTAECPICGDRSMSAEYLQLKHIDECLSGKKKRVGAVKRKRNEISQFFQSRKKANNIDHQQFYFEQAEKHHHETKRMPRIDFGSISTLKLKEKLAGLKLSALGLRPQLELRYNQYMLFFNSNLDTNRPVSELELRQKLNQWEKSHLAFKPLALNSIFGDSLIHKNITDKDFPIKAWEERYRDEFRELVRAARKSRVQGKTSEMTEKSSQMTVKSSEMTEKSSEMTNQSDAIQTTSSQSEAVQSTPTTDLYEVISGQKDLNKKPQETKTISEESKEPSSRKRGEILESTSESTSESASESTSTHRTRSRSLKVVENQAFSLSSIQDVHLVDHTGTLDHPSPQSAVVETLNIGGGNNSEKNEQAFDLSTLILFIPLQH